MTLLLAVLTRADSLIEEEVDVKVCAVESERCENGYDIMEAQWGEGG